MMRARASSLISVAHRSILYESRATYIRGYWPEPITQQTLGKFLQDINYFDEPKKLINIGLEKAQPYKQKTIKVDSFADDPIDTSQSAETSPQEMDQIFDLLSQEATVPPFNDEDAVINGDQLINCAITDGIYRDLFGKYVPNRDYIKFTKEQAERMDKLVPFHWITDQPFARVDRKLGDSQPLYYFEPCIGISAKFVHDLDSQGTDESGDLYAHTSYHGNFIPACEASNPPSITLDGKSLQKDSGQTVKRESEFNNWISGQVNTANFTPNIDKYYSIALVNLDSVHEYAANLHWMLANIKPSSSDTALGYDEVCKYLPVHGIRGFGHSRYVFLVFQHDAKLNAESAKIEGFSLDTRKFDANSFINQHKDINIKPVGLSWFQTSWDLSSNNVFHNYLNVRAPTYEYVQEKYLPKPNPGYPGKIPFNIFLDHNRSKKSINEQVLLERMKIIDPFDYKDQYVPPKVPPTVFSDDNIPSWMNNVMFKKKNKIGYWRGLRPTSVSLPLDNNADLDYPIRPISSSKKQPPGFPNLYPGRGVKKMHKNMPSSKPVTEFQQVFIQDDHEIHLDKVKKVMEEFKATKK